SFYFSSRRRHTRSKRDWSSDVCSSDLESWRRNQHIINVQRELLSSSRFLHPIPQRKGKSTTSLESFLESRLFSKIHLLLLLKHLDRKSTRLNSSHVSISYAVFCLNKKK